MNRSQELYIEALLKEQKKSGHKCKQCNSDCVYPVGPFGHSEHCRDCDNWQASF